MNYRKKAMLMAGALLCLNLSIYSQSISLKMSNVSVKKAMTELQTKSGYSFVYIAGDVDTDRTVSINASQLKDAVAQILKGQNVSYEIQGKNIVIKKGSQQQVTSGKRKKVTGTVKDTNGEPIIGATVVEKGTTNGTVTDFDGNYTLELSENGTLAISYIGYKTQEYSVGKIKQGQLSVILKEDTEIMDEVVVVGYGTQKKSSITGSVAAIKGDDITGTAASNVGSTLAGRLPGLIAYNRGGEPGADNATLNIRGFGSPLVIVDGVEVRDFQKMNPNDIESFSVLKDASASIYGARAGNGVILIKTKRGISGKPELTFDTTLSWQSAIDPVEFVDVNDFIMLWNEAADNSGQPERKYTPDQIEKYKREGGTDWYDVTFRKRAPMQQYNISLRGGTEKVKYYVAAGYMHQTGLLRSNDQQIRRYNLRSNLDIQLLDNLSISVDISGTWNNTDVPALSMWDTYANIFIARPTDPAYWPNPNYAPKSTYHGEWASTAFSTRKDFRGYRRNDDYSILPSVTINYDFKFLEFNL